MGYYTDTPKSEFKRTCEKCHQTYQESLVENHHIIPKGLGGTDADGRIMLCRENLTNDCHMKLHKEINKKLKEITLDWLKEDKKDDTKAA